MEEFDLVVIGGGPAGYSGALRAAEDGARVALVEAENLGGNCVNHACVPSRILLDIAEQSIRNRELEFAGVVAPASTVVDFARAAARKDSLVSELRSAVGAALRHGRVKHFDGRGALSAPGRVLLDLREGGNTEVLTANVLLATGSRAELPTLPDARPLDAITADALWIARELPAEGVVVRGEQGSPIFAAEVAYLLAVFGSTVTLIEQGDSLLPGEEPELSVALRQSLEALGVSVLTRARVTGRTGSTVTVNQTVEVPADAVVIGDCRVPFDGGSGLRELGAAYDGLSIVVDDKQRTSVASVFAAGDATGVGFSNVAAACGRRAAESALGLLPTIDLRFTPRAITTFPEFAAVGVTEAEAVAAGYDVITGVADLSFNARAISSGARQGAVKVVSERRLHQILGVHILGAQASELINQASLAMRLEATLEDLAAVPGWHPTLSEGLGVAARRALRAAGS
ncbi:MAG: FAD-dependent oxidoreductase [Dehalococcoidia bacterium]|nr:FAD-dependent oxidoreductase [Dehalococcoidia bacterium]